MSRKIFITIISILIFIILILNGIRIIEYYSWTFDYGEYVMTFPDQYLGQSWLSILFAIITFIFIELLLVVFLILQLINPKFNKGIIYGLILVIVCSISANVYMVTFGFENVRSSVYEESCAKYQYLTEFEINKLYNEKIRNTWLELQKQDSKFKSMNIYPVDNNLLRCPGKYYFLIEYDESINSTNGNASYIIKNTFTGILRRSDYQILYKDDDYFNRLIRP